jgi:cysteine-rich repeat protein
LPRSVPRAWFLALPLAFAAVLATGGCGYGELCFGDRCEPEGDYGDCGPWGCSLCPEGGYNGNGHCIPQDCWCDGLGNDNCACASVGVCGDGIIEGAEQCEDGNTLAGDGCSADCRLEAEPTWCESSADCGAGRVCSAWNECHDMVTGCPLTEECLADPEGYTPDWMGVDPLYMGEASGAGISARMELLVDFYTDHFYGDALAVVQTGGFGEEILDLIVTGNRDASALDGQVVERHAQPRRFDAVLTAELVTASEIVGEVTVATDQGTFTLAFHLYRISPCGCDPAAPCTVSADCPASHRCEAGSCVPDCEPPAGSECCDNVNCPAGDECVNGTCLTPCTSSCDWAPGELCDAGYCQPAP